MTSYFKGFCCPAQAVGTLFSLLNDLYGLFTDIPIRYTDIAEKVRPVRYL